MKINRHIVLLILIPLCAPSSAKSKGEVEPTARPFLIVPGFSIGKVQLGQSQEIVRQKMGQPTKSLFCQCYTITSNTHIYGIDRESMGTVGVDTWLRPVSPEDKKRNLQDGHPNIFKVLYKNDKVVQVTITLSGYMTKENLSINSTFQEFEKQYGEPGEANRTWFDLDSQRLAGSSAYMKSFWDFRKYGLTLESDTYSDGYDPTAVFALSVHPQNQLYLFDSSM